MSRATGIEWTDATWNPIRGCSRVSEGCRHCYAETVANRFCGPGKPYEGLVQLGADGKGNGKWNGQIRFIEKRLLDPLRWALPQKIFVNSMSDLFHENVTDEMLDRIFAVMALCPQHTFQVLTKRPERMLKYLSRPSAVAVHWISIAASLYLPIGLEGKMQPIVWTPPNVWLGVSVEDQKTADERIPLLLQTPAAVRFISAEPLLGPVNLGFADGLPVFRSAKGARMVGMPAGNDLGEVPEGWYKHHGNIHPWLDWVIVGGESGPGARPMHPDWARSLRDQCQAAGVPFFFKQWGEWKSGDQELAPEHGIAPNSIPPERVCWHQADGRTSSCGSGPRDFELGPKNLAIRVGKKAAGHLFDGEVIQQFPEVRA